MFKRTKGKHTSQDQDITQLLQAMDNIIAGNLDEIDTSVFENPMFGEKLNNVIRTFKKAINPTVMRLNETMETIGDNTLIKDTIEQVQAQTSSIHDMESASIALESSIASISEAMGHIRDNTHDILSSSENIVSHMNESMNAVSQSSGMLRTINDQVQNFKEKIDRIGEIVTLVKNIANQSNLLALNASIEAARAGESGKGFAVVADQVRQLSLNTSESAQDIVDYVGQLQVDVDVLAASMEETTSNLEESNRKVESSLMSMQQMNSQMTSIRTSVDNIFEDIDTQTGVTKNFTQQMENISQRYNQLSEDCIQSGKHIFQVGRYLDKTRSDLVRGFSLITEQDWLRVFEVDHYILTWRIYNNIVGFEHLQRKQVDNPSGCKLGKWMQQQTNPALTQSAEFQKVNETHKELHKLATKSWEAKEEGNETLALSYFQQSYDAFHRYDSALHDLQEKMRSLGYLEQTQIVKYKE